MNKRVLYVQFTNPGAYPPLQHSSSILAERGWEVFFIGTGSMASDVLRIPEHPNIRVLKLPFCVPGLRQKTQYLYFCFLALMKIALWKPDWVYASNSLSCPIGLLAQLAGVKTIYHEHDSPSSKPSGTIPRKISDRIRQWLSRRARICILPNEGRLRNFLEETGRKKKSFCVWNCPEKREVLPVRTAMKDGLKIVYQGVVGPNYLPETLVDALALLPEQVTLSVFGYETIGSSGYSSCLKEKTKKAGLEKRFLFFGTLPRRELLARCSEHDVGLAFSSSHPEDVNLRHRVGASNKPFDYLACGVALLVSDLPGVSDWKQMHADTGHGLTCDPADPKSIACALQWFLEHPDETRAMGEKGRQRILSDWNYETQFQPVLELLENGAVFK